MNKTYANIVLFLAAALTCSAAPILLKTGAIDPQAEAAQTIHAVKSLTKTGAAAGGVYLIQHDGLITDVWREALTAGGAKILGYVPENAYIIGVSAEALAKIKETVPYSYLGEYKPAYKIAAEASSTAKAMALTKTSAAEATAVYTVSLFAATNRGATAAAIAAITGCSVVSQDGAIIRAALTAEGVEAVAQISGVEWVSPFHERKLCNNIAVQAPRMNVETVWPSGDSGLGLTGAGQTVAVCDTGLDTGNQPTLHKDVRGRVTRTFALGRSNDWSDTDGHGTHVCGSVAGNGTMSSSPKIRGVAYGCSLIMQSVMDSRGQLGGIPDDIDASLFPQVYEDESSNSGARIHSDSWGTEEAGQYTADSRAVDKYTFEHPDFLVVVAAGNEAVDDVIPYGVVDTGSIDAPATAKNCIAVGASENYRTTGGYAADKWTDFGFKYSPINTDYCSRPYDGQHQGMCPASCRGPCTDNRIKPDLVAPGTDILSLKSSVVIEDPSSDYSELYYNNYYWFSTGTSMSTPLVAGSAALIREWLHTYYDISNPLASTVKALLISGAKSLAPGQFGTGSKREIPAEYPNNVEGWGQVNVGNTCAMAPTIYDGAAITNGETQYVSVLVPTNGISFNVVMAYSDAPASLSSSKQLVNDLDLTIMKPDGTLVYPNSRTSADRVNNVEGVRFSNAPAGIYWIEVDGHNIPQPMNTSITKENAAQLFSLVISGAEIVTDETVQMSGPQSIESGKSDYCTCELVYNGSYPVDVSVDAQWSASPAELVTVKNGILTTARVSTNATITVTAEYDGSIVTMDIPLTPFTTKAVFNSAGGKPATTNITELSGSPYVLPSPNPTRAGYVFNGWWTSGTAGEAVTAETIVTNYLAHTLYAHWLKAYTLTARNAAIIGYASPAAILQGMTVFITASDLSASHQVFAGWTVSPSTANLGDAFNASSASTPLTMPAANVSITATYITAPGYIAVNAIELNTTANASQTPVGIQWTTDNKTWIAANDGLAYPVKNGTVSVTFRSTDTRWVAPSRVSLRLAADASTNLTVSATRVSLVSAVTGDSGAGTVTLSPVKGQVLNGKAVTLTSRVGKDSVFVDWRDPEDNWVSSAASLKAAPNADTVYTARFRLKTDCQTPAVAFTPSWNAIVGVKFLAQATVQDEALPVKFTASSLPSGLTIDSASGIISGVPARAGTYTTTITATSVANAKLKTVLSQPITVDALPAAMAGTFNGIAYSAADLSAAEDPETPLSVQAFANAARATLTFTATANGRLTAKLIGTNGAINVSSASWDTVTGGVYYVTMSTTKGETLSVNVNSSADWQHDQLSGDLTTSASENFYLKARRNPFGKSGSAYETPAATNALAAVLGYYTAAIPAEFAMPNEMGMAENQPRGNGFFSVTLKNTGIATLTGTLADGTRISASGTVSIDPDGTAWLDCFVPLYSSKGFWSSRINLSGNTIPLSGATRHLYPGKTPTGKTPAVEDRFDFSGYLVGCWYNTTADLAAYYAGATFTASDMPVGYTYIKGAWTNDANFVTFPNEAITADARGNLRIPASKTPVYDAAAGAYVYSTTNPCCATLTVAKATGLFSGTFNIYYEYLDEKSTLKLKTVKTSYNGILTPTAEGALGWGFYLTPETWIDDSAAKPVSYSIKRSASVEISR